LQKLDTLLEGKYEILDRLREGGMGTIYRVRHRLLDEVRVIKVMRPHAVADKDLKRRFFDEARTATRLKHPNICQILDFALDDEGTAYLVMEYIEGINLAELLGVKGPPTTALALEIAHQTLLALGYLHRKNVVHRDIAPDNVMVSRAEDGKPLIKLVDLGIAKVADAPTEMTQTGVFLGKLRYASPEQFGALEPGQRLDGRSDLYSLGVVMFELLTGVRPFAGESPPELLRAHLFNPPMPFAAADPMNRVPPELRATILKALEKKRDNRWANAEEFDREILSLQRRTHRDGDAEATIAFLATLPRIEPPERPLTGSAQDRLDRQFGPQRTPPPTPSTPSLTLLPTAIAPGTPLSEASEPSQSGIPTSKRVPTATTQEQIASLRGPAQRRAPWLIALGAGLLALAAIFLLRSPRARTARETAGIPALPRAASPAAGGASASPRPTSAPSPVAVAALPSSEPTVAPSPEAAPPPPLAAAPEPAAEPTRAAARPSPRPTHVRTAPTARRAAAPGTPPVPTAPVLVAEARPAQIPPEPTRAVPPPPPAAAAVAPSVPTAAPAKPAPTENDRIRDALHRYERAQSTLDAVLYKRVFPTVDEDRIAHAFASLQSQSVELEVRRILISPDGSKADVFAFERRTALPRAGSEQRIQADRVLHLEKQGDAWVITKLD
jgi:serine/threonine-protein kinase